MAVQAKRTTEHEVIRAWVEERGGLPAVVAGTRDGEEGGVLRVDFGDHEEDLEEVSWDEFFKLFEEHDLAFLYTEQTATGGESYFHKFVEREDADVEDEIDELDLEMADVETDEDDAL